MEFSLARNWWLLVLRGVIAVAFGILVFFWPTLAWIVVVASFGAYALVDGCFAIAAAMTGHAPGRQWWALLIEGIFGILAGVFTLLWPGLTELALLYWIAFWAMATGIFEIIAAFRLRQSVAGEMLLALSGVLSVLFGIALVILPGPGALAIAWLIGAYALVFGVLMLVLGFRLRAFAHRGPGVTAVPMP